MVNPQKLADSRHETELIRARVRRENAATDSAKLTVLTIEVDETMSETRRLLGEDDGSCHAPNMLRSIRETPQKSEKNAQADGLVVARIQDTIHRLLSSGVSRETIIASLLVVSRDL